MMKRLLMVGLLISSMNANAFFKQEIIDKMQNFAQANALNLPVIHLIRNKGFECQQIVEMDMLTFNEKTGVIEVACVSGYDKDTFIFADYLVNTKTDEVSMRDLNASK